MLVEGNLIVKDRFDASVQDASDAVERHGQTRQEYKNDCDINKMMSRYLKTGQLPNLIKKDPTYGDFSEAPDYQAAMSLVTKAQTQFNALSSEVRNRFKNSPELFLDFATDEANAEEMVKLGLATKRVVETPSNASSVVSKKASQVKKTENAKKAPDES